MVIPYKGGKLTDYHIYKLNLKELIIYGTIYIAVISVISIVFYSSLLPVILFSPGCILYYRFVRTQLKAKQDNRLTMEFKDLLTSVSSLLSTGYSLENALIESRKELLSIHGNCLMIRELDRMISLLMIHVPIEQIFNNFASRTDIDDIKTFSEILSIAKQSGGDLIHIIFATSSSISSHVNICMEINTVLSGKKFELYIMAVMPIIIMLYVSLTQPGFFEPMYHNVGGIIIMSICLSLYLIAIFIAYKIISIKDR